MLPHAFFDVGNAHVVVKPVLRRLFANLSIFGGDSVNVRRFFEIAVIALP